MRFLVRSPPLLLSLFLPLPLALSLSRFWTWKTRYHVQMKWLVVAAILAYLALRVYVYFKPGAPISRAFRRRYLLRTDAAAMSRRELVLSALSFLAFATAAAGLYVGVVWGGAELGWRLFDARPVVVLGKAGLFIGAMALAACVFLLGVALIRR